MTASFWWEGLLRGPTLGPGGVPGIGPVMVAQPGQWAELEATCLI